MSFLGNLFGGSTKQTDTRTTTNDPPAYAQPFLTSALNRAEEVYQTPRSYFPGQTWVDFAPATLEALNRGEARAYAGSPLARSAKDFMGTALGGGFINPAAAQLGETARGDFLGGNPFLTAALQPVRDRISGQFSGAGRYGSGAHAAAMTGALAPVYAENYARERANQLAAQRSIGNLAQSDFQNRFAAAAAARPLADADYTDIGRLAGIGQAREQQTAKQLTDEMARFDFLQNLPQERLTNFINTVRPSTVGNRASQPIYSNPTSSAIGNIAALGQAANYISKLF